MSRLDDLLAKEMTRKQFIATLGLAVVSLFGFSTIIGLLTPEKRGVGTGSGFGSGDYGL